MNSKTGFLVVAILTIATVPAPPMAEHSHQRHPTNQTPPLQTDTDWIRVVLPTGPWGLPNGLGLRSKAPDSRLVGRALASGVRASVLRQGRNLFLQ
jgi:hypothetical protein